MNIMAALTREQLREKLKRREIAPVYVLYGAETYLRDLAAKTITDFSFAEGEFRDFNETHFSLNREESLQLALGAAEQLPMMASRRVVRITDVKISASGFRDTVREEHEKALAAYFTNPSPHAVVIFIADELNRVRKIGKFLADHAGVVAVDFKPLTDHDLSEWARKEI